MIREHIVRYLLLHTEERGLEIQTDLGRLHCVLRRSESRQSISDSKRSLYDVFQHVALTLPLPRDSTHRGRCVIREIQVGETFDVVVITVPAC